MPQPCSRPPRPTPLLETPGHSWVSLGHSLTGSLILSPGSWCAQGSVCALQKYISPVLCEFLRLYGGVNGDSLQEGLCHTQVCSIQGPYPCSRTTLDHASTGDTRTFPRKLWSVSSGVTAPFSWVLVCTRFCLCPPRVCFPSPV